MLCPCATSRSAEERCCLTKGKKSSPGTSELKPLLNALLTICKITVDKIRSVRFGGTVAQDATLWHTVLVEVKAVLDSRRNTQLDLCKATRQATGHVGCGQPDSLMCRGEGDHYHLYPARPQATNPPPGPSPPMVT